MSLRQSLLVLIGVLLALPGCASATDMAQPIQRDPKAYVVVESTVTDPVVYEAYKAAIAPVAIKHGGRYIVRAGRTVSIEGAPPEGRIVLFEFPSFDQAMAFERSPEALKASELRNRSAKARIYVVEGVVP